LAYSKALITFQHQVALTLWRIGLAGSAVDIPAFDALAQKWKGEADRAEDQLKKAAVRLGMAEFIPTADEHLRILLFEKLKLPIKERTEKEKLPSVAKPVIKEFAVDEPTVQMLLDFNAADKRSSTWGNKTGGASTRKSLGEMIIPFSDTRGLLHFWINPAGARTGRRSSGGLDEETGKDSRNSQNWPGEAKAMLVSRWKDGKVASVDFSRLEVVLRAWMCGDKKLFDYFMGGDGYIGVALEIFGIEVVKDTKEYKATKNIVLGCNYNMDDWKMSKYFWDMLEIRYSDNRREHDKEVGRMRARYLRMFPGIARINQERIREMRRTQAVTNPIGQVRHLPHNGTETPGFWHLENQACNFPEQSMAAAVTGSAMIDFERGMLHNHKMSYLDWHKALLGTPWDPPASVLTNEIHDQLDIDLHPKTGEADLELLKWACKKLPTLRKMCPSFNFELNMDVSIGDHL